MPSPESGPSHQEEADPACAGAAPGTAAPPPPAGAGQHRLESFIASLPKAELHVHVEGTLEPEFMMECGRRNGVELPYADLAAAKAARLHYGNLAEFLAAYFHGMSVLQKELDFFELADAYLARAAAEGVRHVELFFDPQAHLSRGVPFAEFFSGLRRAAAGAPARHGVSCQLIMCFLRDLGPQGAAEVLEQAVPYRSHISGVGLDSTEIGFPPHLFRPVFERAAELGWRRVAHAGEEAGPDYVWSAIRDLCVDRIDHGVKSLEDPQLVAHLEATGIPLTVCPLSNLCLQVYAGCLEAKLRQLLAETRIAVTLNSDDPAYFSGYINANYAYAAAAAGLEAPQLAELAAASFRASFLDAAEKQRHLDAVQAALHAWEAGQQQHAC